MQIIPLATGVTGTGAQATVITTNSVASMAAQRDNMTVSVTVTGGSARNVNIEVSVDGINWATVGSAVTTITTSIQSILRAPYVRLNVTSNTGSTVGGTIAL